MNLNSNVKFLLMFCFAFLAIFCRIFVGIPNFSPMTALALFAVTFFGWRIASFAAVLGIQMVGDFLLALKSGNWEYFLHPSMGFVYGAYMLIALMGYAVVRKLSYQRTIPFALSASVLFFLITNFASFLTLNIYSKDFEGLVDCYRGGLAFYRTAFVSDMVFSLAFCGLALELAKAPAGERI